MRALAAAGALRHWKRPGTSRSNIEAADLTPVAPAVVTRLAREVLRAAGDGA